MMSLSGNFEIDFTPAKLQRQQLSPRTRVGFDL